MHKKLKITILIIAGIAVGTFVLINAVSISNTVSKMFNINSKMEAEKKNELLLDAIKSEFGKQLKVKSVSNYDNELSCCFYIKSDTHEEITNEMAQLSYDVVKYIEQFLSDNTDFYLSSGKFDISIKFINGYGHSSIMYCYFQEDVSDSSIKLNHVKLVDCQHLEEYFIKHEDLIVESY